MSLSKQLRLEGNECLLSATDDLAPIVWETRMNSAMGKYHNAIHSALNAEEAASAMKNYGVVAMKMASYYRERQTTKVRAKLVLHYYRECIRYLNKSITKGSSVKCTDWLTDMQVKLYDCIQAVYEYARNEMQGQDRVNILQRIMDVLQTEQHRGECLIEIATTYFKESVLALDKGDYRKALSNLRDCHRPLEESKLYGRLSQDEHLLSEGRILEEDVFLQTCVAESIQARTMGDQMLESALSNYETLPMPLIWDVIDVYRNARILCNEKDIELEAIAYARIGKVYHQVLKYKSISKQHYVKAIDLAASLHPKTFYTDEWYKECSLGLAELQKESLVEEDKRRQEARAATLEILKDKLKELDDNTDNATDLLKYVYKTYPPKNLTHKLPAEFKASTKKILCSAILHYHPDKVDEEEHGKEWKVLCEEITKRLTNFYECCKL